MELIRVSCYNIYLKSPDPEYSYLVHGYTGAIDVVTNTVAQFLKSVKVITQEDIDNNVLPVKNETIESLKQRGYLTTKMPNEEKERVWKLAEVLHRRVKLRSSFLFLIAYDCNFRCPYCYENNISDKGRGWSKKVFSKEMVDRAYATMLEIQPNNNLHGKSITLYGGEPLLATNYEIVKYIVDEGLKRGYVFSAITNGYDLDHFEDLVVPGKIERLQITVDGMPTTHDKRRTHYVAGNSFERIMQNIKSVLSRNVVVSVRINTDMRVLNELTQVINIFKEQGFLDKKNFSAYSASIHGEDEAITCNTVMVNISEKKEEVQIVDNIVEINASALTNNGGEIYFTGPAAQYIDFDKEEALYKSFLEGNPRVKFHYENDESTVVDKIEKMDRVHYIKQFFSEQRKTTDMQKVGCQDFSVRSTLRNALNGKGIMGFRSVFCAAQSGMIIFDPYGDLYTCWEHVGIPQYKIGTYAARLEFIESEVERWWGKNISKVSSCSKCKYALFCGGGCTIRAVNEGRGSRSSYCDGYPGTFQLVATETIAEFLAEKQSIPMTQGQSPIAVGIKYVSQGTEQSF